MRATKSLADLLWRAVIIWVLVGTITTLVVKVFTPREIADSVAPYVVAAVWTLALIVAIVNFKYERRLFSVAGVIRFSVRQVLFVAVPCIALVCWAMSYSISVRARPMHNVYDVKWSYRRDARVAEILSYVERDLNLSGWVAKQLDANAAKDVLRRYVLSNGPCEFTFEIFEENEVLAARLIIDGPADRECDQDTGRFIPDMAELLQTASLVE
jgi:hypothetical protein